MLHSEITTWDEICAFARLHPEQIHSPFQSPEYGSLFLNHFADQSKLLLLKIVTDATQEMVGYGMFEVSDRSLLLLGMRQVEAGQEITDYGDIVLASEDAALWLKAWRAVIAYLTLSNSNKNFDRIQLDYVRSSSNTSHVLEQLSRTNAAIHLAATEQEITSLVRLESIWETYLSNLSHSHRKELKRKQRRLESIAHHITLHSEITAETIDIFLALHRRSDPKKEQFMNQKMTRFFTALLQKRTPPWKPALHFLFIENAPAAALFTFENETQVLAYNSGHDPQFERFSPGFLLHAAVIRAAGTEGKIVYDLLRGREHYKRDLGAQPEFLQQWIIQTHPE